MDYPQRQLIDNVLNELIPYKIHDILLVASEYDAFIFAKDGQLVEKIYNDYSSLNLQVIPQISRASQLSEVTKILATKRIDLVITMIDLPDVPAVKLTEVIKEQYPELPIVLMVNDLSLTSSIQTQQLQNHFDGIFFWSGDSYLFFAIVKYIEDKKNIGPDVLATGFIKVILVIEDSMEYYSKFLPLLYQEIMKQTKVAMQEGVNHFEALKRMKTRPKILLAHNYEQAISYFEKFNQNILGVISDIRFPKGDKELADAGFLFEEHLRTHIHHVPLLFMSSEEENRKRARSLERDFINKKSHIVNLGLTQFIKQHMGFGDFVFITPNKNVVGRASGLKELQELLEVVPEESLLYHAQHNHISAWLAAHGHLSLANQMRPIKINKFEDPEELRNFLVTAIKDSRYLEQSGVVVTYQKDNWDATFIQIGNESLGGKARGLAFTHYLLAVDQIRKKYPSIALSIPKTVAISTDIFDQFIEQNNLHDVLFLNDDDEIAKKFINARLPFRAYEKLHNFLLYHHMPLAIRSSSLLEDSNFLPFAGIYSTYMIPNNHVNIETRLDELERAIKLVYASVFFTRSKSYIASTPYKLENEKMAIVLQEVIGEQFANYFYPHISGVAESYNFYPFSYMKAEEGVARIAFGLGKTVMDGEKSLRFSPTHPDLLSQYYSLEQTLMGSQKNFYAIDMHSSAEASYFKESQTVPRLPIKSAPLSALKHVASVYDVDNQQLKSDLTLSGVKVLTFEKILKYNFFPVSELLKDLLAVFKQAMGRELQMEFAILLSNHTHDETHAEAKHTFKVLQVRPLVVRKEEVAISEEEKSSDQLVIFNQQALGNGQFHLKYFIIVKPEVFDFAVTNQIAEEIGELNQMLVEKAAKYILIGPGRWGTSDPWLGVPVQWNQINQTALIIETDHQQKFIDPSQGGHFFHNITSRSIGHFTLLSKNEKDLIRWDYLNSLPVERELKYVKCVVDVNEVVVKIDGKNQQGLVTRYKQS
ncbi:MAG: hypothetical protein HQK50_04695 [Oligoflexia bacterium]|nr:hypothetical protein [Oligoflexia bacterium]MBF0364844.1 hypothetical protein [Oligoflexia bacterium]